MEYRFTDFRFCCARSARGQGVYISFSDFGVFTLIKNTSQNGTLHYSPTFTGVVEGMNTIILLARRDRVRAHPEM